MVGNALNSMMLWRFAHTRLHLCVIRVLAVIGGIVIIPEFGVIFLSATVRVEQPASDRDTCGQTVGGMLRE